MWSAPFASSCTIGKQQASGAAIICFQAARILLDCPTAVEVVGLIPNISSAALIPTHLSQLDL